MSLININWTPHKKELQKFGITMLVGFAIIAAFLFWQRQNVFAFICGLVGLVFGLAGLSATPVGLLAYKIWMSVALVFGNIMSRVMLFLFFYLFLTPIALFFKIIRRDKLMLRKPCVDTYWIDVEYESSKRLSERPY